MKSFAFKKFGPFFNFYKKKYINKLDGNVQLPQPKGLYRSKNCNPVVNEI